MTAQMATRLTLRTLKHKKRKVTNNDGNAALEQVNCSVSNYSWRDVPRPENYWDELEDRYEVYFSWISKLTCWFIFQCPIDCHCNLTATNITITCPDGLSIAKVEYPSGGWLTYSPDWISRESEDEKSIEYEIVTIYSWNENRS